MDTLQIPLSLDTDAVDWNRVVLFRRRVETLWDNFKDLNLGQFRGSFAKRDNGGYEGGFDLPNEHRLKGLYVDYRHFYLNDEPTNINAFANYLTSLTDSAEYKKFIKDEKLSLKSDFIENGWLRHNGKPFTTKQVLDTWFNAEIFHSNPKKIPIILDWMNVLSTDTAKSMLFMAVYDSIMVIRNINWSASELSVSNPYLRMPNK